MTNDLDRLKADVLRAFASVERPLALRGSNEGDLWHGLDDASKDTPVNPRRYGDRTWMGAMRHRFSVFSRDQAQVILRYLQRKAAEDDFSRPSIEQAIANDWRARAG